MSFYNEMGKIASDILGDGNFRQGTIEYVRMIPGTGGTIDEPTDPVPNIQPDRGGVVKGVGFKYIQSGLALASDKTVIIPAIKEFQPSPEDYILIDSEKYSIIQDISVPQAGIRVVWKFIVRKG